MNQPYNYSTVLGAAIKCKPYSEITVEIGTHSKTVKITLQCRSAQFFNKVPGIREERIFLNKKKEELRFETKLQ